jgi:hypothetical protein
MTLEYSPLVLHVHTERIQACLSCLDTYVYVKRAFSSLPFLNPMLCICRLKLLNIVFG